jgi:cytochrome bd ubiquinol oxidase subunit I
MNFLDAELLARIQFAFTISFHIIFPSFTIGLASWLAVLEGLYLKTNKSVYSELYQFWVKIFAVSFGMGVVSGLVMSYQFGTNWSGFSDKVGNILGPLMAFEVLTAFFLESSFLGIMLFGWGRVSKKMHFAATIAVAVGTLISAFWILSANGWMHTPAGFRVENGIFYPTDWLAIIFNPSFYYKLPHMVVAAYLTTAFAVLAVGSWYLLNKKFIPHAKVMVGMSSLLIVMLAPLQPIIGDFHGLNTLEYQPQKVAAMEGIWENEKGAALRLFAIPDEKNETNSYSLEIPKLSSLILTHSLEGEVKGLKSWAKEERPPVKIVFFSFRVMVGIGLLMVFTAIIMAFLFYKERLFNCPAFFRWGMIMGPSGFIAVLAGWFVTEVGRQPYLVYGLLHRSEGLSPVLGEQIAISLIAFIVVYTFVFGMGIYYIFHLMAAGPLQAKKEETFGSHGVVNTVIKEGKHV